MSSKTVYNIADASPTTAFENPVRAGHYLLPANSTEIAPPEFDVNTHTCLFNGTEWVVTEIPVPEPSPEPEPYVETYVDLRLAEYGSPQEQLEFIVENGMDAFIQKQLEIKSKYPKPE